LSFSESEEAELRPVATAQGFLGFVSAWGKHWSSKMQPNTTNNWS